MITIDKRAISEDVTYDAWGFEMVFRCSGQWNNLRHPLEDFGSFYLIHEKDLIWNRRPIQTGKQWEFVTQGGNGQEKDYSVKKMQSADFSTKFTGENKSGEDREQMKTISAADDQTYLV